jgi:hypothetical protein
MRTLVVLDGLELDLRAVAEAIHHLPGVEAVIAGLRERSLRGRAPLSITVSGGCGVGRRNSIA